MTAGPRTSFRNEDELRHLLTEMIKAKDPSMPTEGLKNAVENVMSSLKEAFGQMPEEPMNADTLKNIFQNDQLMKNGGLADLVDIATTAKSIVLPNNLPLRKLIVDLVKVLQEEPGPERTLKLKIVLEKYINAIEPDPNRRQEFGPMLDNLAKQLNNDAMLGKENTQGVLKLITACLELSTAELSFMNVSGGISPKPGVFVPVQEARDNALGAPLVVETYNALVGTTRGQDLLTNPEFQAKDLITPNPEIRDIMQELALSARNAPPNYTPPGQ